MDFTLTEEQKQIKVLVKEFCEREIDPKDAVKLVDKITKAQTLAELRAAQPLHLLEKAHKVGLRQLGVPKKYGGTAPDSEGNVTRVLAIEQLGYSGGPMSFLLGFTWGECNIVAKNPYFTEEQRGWFFSQYMGNPTFCMGATVSEPAGSTDIHLPYDEPGVAGKVFAHKDGNEWVINGDKMFSSGGGVADLFMVEARTNKEGPISESATCFWVRKDTPGVTMTINKLIAVELGGNVQTNYDNVRVPEIQVMGQVNKGYNVFEWFFATKWLVVAGLLGHMQKLYEDVRDYAKERVQGGKPLIQHSAIAAMLGDMGTQLEALRAFIHKAAWEADQWESIGGVPLNLFWPQGCFYLYKMLSWHFCEIAGEVYGGIGLSVDLPLESFVRHAFGFRPGGCTPMINSVKCSNQYDNRYKYELW